jgi:hypothetical protein
MEIKKSQERKLMPNVLHWIAGLLFTLGLSSSITAFYSPDNQYSNLHLLLLPVIVGMSPYLALAAFYIFSIIWYLIAYTEFRLFETIKGLWRRKNT